MNSHQKDADSVTRQADELQQLGAEGAVEPALTELTARWNQLQSQVNQYNKPHGVSSLATTAPVTMATQPVTTSSVVTR